MLASVLFALSFSVATASPTAWRPQLIKALPRAHRVLLKLGKLQDAWKRAAIVSGQLQQIAQWTQAQQDLALEPIVRVMKTKRMNEESFSNLNELEQENLLVRVIDSTAYHFSEQANELIKTYRDSIVADMPLTPEASDKAEKRRLELVEKRGVWLMPAVLERLDYEVRFAGSPDREAVEKLETAADSLDGELEAAVRRVDEAERELKAQTGAAREEQSILKEAFGHFEVLKREFKESAETSDEKGQLEWAEQTMEQALAGTAHLDGALGNNLMHLLTPFFNRLNSHINDARLYGTREEAREAGELATKLARFQRLLVDLATGTPELKAKMASLRKRSQPATNVVYAARNANKEIAEWIAHSRLDGFAELDQQALRSLVHRLTRDAEALWLVQEGMRSRAELPKLAADIKEVGLLLSSVHADQHRSEEGELALAALKVSHLNAQRALQELEPSAALDQQLRKSVDRTLELLLARSEKYSIAAVASIIQLSIYAAPKDVAQNSKNQGS